MPSAPRFFLKRIPLPHNMSVDTQQHLEALTCNDEQHHKRQNPHFTSVSKQASSSSSISAASASRYSRRCSASPTSLAHPRSYVTLNDPKAAENDIYTKNNYTYRFDRARRSGARNRRLERAGSPLRPSAPGEQQRGSRSTPTARCDCGGGERENKWVEDGK